MREDYRELPNTLVVVMAMQMVAGFLHIAHIDIFTRKNEGMYDAYANMPEKIRDSRRQESCRRRER